MLGLAGTVRPHEHHPTGSDHAGELAHASVELVLVDVLEDVVAHHDVDARVRHRDPRRVTYRHVRLRDALARERDRLGARVEADEPGEGPGALGPAEEATRSATGVEQGLPATRETVSSRTPSACNIPWCHQWRSSTSCMRRWYSDGSGVRSGRGTGRLSAIGDRRRVGVDAGVLRPVEVSQPRGVTGSLERASRFLTRGAAPCVTAA